MGKWAKRLKGEREIGRNDPGRNDSGRKGKCAKRLRGERESGRNDPDSFVEDELDDIKIEMNENPDMTTVKMSFLSR